MSSRTDEDRIRLYRKSLGYAWGFVDYNDWPVKLNSVFHLFLSEFGEELLDDLDYLENIRQMPLKKIALAFYNPARIYRMIDTTVYGLKRRKFTLQQQREVVLKMLSLVRCLKYGSEFNEDGRNLIYNPETEKEVMETKLLPRETTLQDSQIVHRFCGLIWAYTEAIFFRAHDVTKEIHGPYSSVHGSNILVKEYLNLNSREIWPDAPLLPYRTIKVYQNYESGMKLSIDALNHLYYEGGAFVKNLRHACIEVDLEKVSVVDLPEIMNRITDAIQHITSKVDGMTWQEKVTKYAEIFWFRKKPLRDLRGLDWRLPDRIREKIAVGQENPKRVERLSEEQVYRLALITI